MLFFGFFARDEIVAMLVMNQGWTEYFTNVPRFTAMAAD